ncbi:nuclear transport factor 2 family protein [Sphingobacterium sp. SYP-B4668]|uniref:nuclear transport factor 2 family protein n=1 Tax=Sphingobacterium sp. SYP-B4668 TaxID=2996035 RepID=UPI0022DD13C4|nr:nuclear transport factor 2 family protein [Sphingobacterium sp. SYP-B4668]
MKNIIKPLVTALLLVTTLSSFAMEKVNPLKNLNSMSIVKTYLQATTLGNIDFNEHLFATDFQYQTTTNLEVKTNKKQYCAFLKANKGLTYDCETAYEILDESGDCCVAKATMKFKNFTRIDYITLCRTQGTWQVSKVVTAYP